MTKLDLEAVNAICYSGYRLGQSPGAGIHPSYEQTKQDLLILARNWKSLRLYDRGPASETVLEVIRRERLDLRVLLGAWLDAEVNNLGCPWGGSYPAEQLAANRLANRTRIGELTVLANRYPEIIRYVSAGNEATVDWTDHLVPVERVLHYVRLLKAGVRQPVTYCDNYVPWLGKLDPVAREVDFVSLHTYPVWEQKTLAESLAYTQENHRAVAGHVAGRPVVITEAGWATASNGRGIPPHHASEELQAAYYGELLEWSRAEGILTYVFEAFDEPWKGSADPDEPEKHWGLFTVDRRPKLAVRALYPDLLRGETATPA
jgi:exo-beta-1,3-glucanase (GH17 family)